jgi:hypothetical protein
VVLSLYSERRSDCCFTAALLFSYPEQQGRGTQVVRERSAKPLYVGSIPTRASSLGFLSLLLFFILGGLLEGADCDLEDEKNGSEHNSGAESLELAERIRKVCPRHAYLCGRGQFACNLSRSRDRGCSSAALGWF